MIIRIALTLQRPADLTNDADNCAVLDVISTALANAKVVPLSLDLSNRSTVALVLEFSRSSDGEPMYLEHEASEWAGDKLFNYLPWDVNEWKTLHFEPLGTGLGGRALFPVG